MNYTEQEAALEQAAAPALAAMEEDERQAPKWLRPLFAACRELLFRPDLELEQIQTAAGFGDAEVWNAMREQVGQPGWNYLRDARLETSAHLLLETEMSVGEVGHLVGYTSAPSFRRLLRSFLGMPASRYRRRARRRLAQAGPLPDGAETLGYWERFEAGELTDDEVRQLDAYLGRLAPASEPPAASEPDDQWTRLRQALADGLLKALDPPAEQTHIILEDGRPKSVPAPGLETSILPFSDQRRLVREAVWFPDGTLFEALSKRSVESDPERGVELAILGVDYLLASRIPEVDPRLTPLAWARLARARWREGDIEGTRLDLERAAQELSTCDPLPVAWQAEIDRITAAFEWSGDRQKALDLANDSVGLYRRANSPELAAALILRAELQAAAADLEPHSPGERIDKLREALADLLEAEEHLHGALPAPAVAWRRAGISLQIRLLASIGTRAEIASALPGLRKKANAHGLKMAAHLRWLKGHAIDDAKPAWYKARKLFIKHEDDLWIARVTLDLARFCLTVDRMGEAAALTSELAVKLKKLHRGKSVGLALPQPFDAITAGDLDRAEKALRNLEWQRRASRALDLAL